MASDRLKDVAEGGIKVAPVPLSSWFAEMSPSEIAGFATAIIGGLYGVLMVIYLLRKWQREEVLFKKSLSVLDRGSQTKIAKKINAVTI